MVRVALLEIEVQGPIARGGTKKPSVHSARSCTKDHNHCTPIKENFQGCRPGEVTEKTSAGFCGHGHRGHGTHKWPDLRFWDLLSLPATWITLERHRTRSILKFFFNNSARTDLLKTFYGIISFFPASCTRVISLLLHFLFPLLRLSHFMASSPFSLLHVPVSFPCCSIFFSLSFVSLISLSPLPPHAFPSPACFISS